MRKVSIVLFLLFCLFLSVVPISSASSANEQNVKLDKVTVTIPYSSSEVDLVRYEEGNEVRVEILNKETGELEGAYGEYPVESNDVGAFSVNTISQHVVYNEVVEGPTTSRLNTRLEIYSSGSFGQINAVLDTWWEERTSGDWELANESASTSSSTGSFPTTGIITSGNATIEVITTSSTSGGFSVSALEILGFEISSEVGSTYYLRKPISTAFTYSL